MFKPKQEESLSSLVSEAINILEAFGVIPRQLVEMSVGLFFSKACAVLSV